MSNPEQPNNVIYHDFTNDGIVHGDAEISVGISKIKEVDFSREGKGTVFAESLNDFKLNAGWDNLMKKTEINYVKSRIVEIYLYIKDLEEIYDGLSQSQSIPLSEFDRLTKRIREISSSTQDIFDSLSSRGSLLEKLIKEKDRKNSLHAVCVALGEKFNRTKRNVSTRIDVLEAKEGELL